MKKATMRDLCDETGLSLGTVSKYLNGGQLKEKNRKKLDEAIERLNYRVDEYARGLITNRTRTVGIITTRLDNLFYSSIISDVETKLYEKGYAAIIKESGYDLSKEIKGIEWFLSRRVDALIIIPVGRKKEDYEILNEAEVPVLFLDSYIEGVRCESIVTDNEEISRHAIDWLISKGHKKISIILDKDNPYTAERRLEGYRQAFKENGMEEEDYRIYRINESIDSGYAVAKQIVTETDSTAIFASNYISTVGVVYLLNELDIRVPEDISVLGFDDILITSLYRPKLTIINQPIEKISQLAVDRLFELLSEENKEYKTHLLENELIIGKTVADIN